MQNLSYSQIKNIAVIEYGWDKEEGNAFMTWLGKQEGINFNSDEEDHGLQNVNQVRTMMHQYQHRPVLLGNAFSLNMIQGNKTLKTRVLDVEDVQDILKERAVVSVVGHDTTAVIFSSMLGSHIPSNRTTVKLEAGDDFIVGQYKGPRLEEGSTSLPDGASIEWIMVTVQ